MHSIDYSASQDEDILSNINRRFYKFLVSRNFALSDDELVDGLYEDKSNISTKEDDKNTCLGRTLLDIEVKAHEKREKKKKQSKELVVKVGKVLEPHYLKDIQRKLDNIDYVCSELISFPAHIFDILETAYSPSVTIKKITAVIPDGGTISRRILQAVNSKGLRKSIGRHGDSRKIDSINGAIGYLGIDGFKALLPFLVFKNVLKPFHQVFKGMLDKIWKHCVCSAVCTNYLLRLRDSKNSFTGYLSSFMSCIGIIAVFHQFYSSFKDVKIAKLEEMAIKKKFNIYDAIFSSDPSEKVMFMSLIKYADVLPEKIMERMNIQAFPEVKNTLRDNGVACKISERSDLSKATKQGIEYSKFELLRRSKFFKKDHFLQFLDAVDLTRQEVEDLVSQDLRKLNMKVYTA